MLGTVKFAGEGAQLFLSNTAHGQDGGHSPRHVPGPSLEEPALCLPLTHAHHLYHSMPQSLACAHKTLLAPSVAESTAFGE